MSENIYKNSEYLSNNPDWHAEDSVWKAQHILNIIKRNNIRPLSVAEVGCGAGEILIQLSLQMPAEASFTGYEISPQALSICSAKENERVKFLSRDIVAENKKYDLLMAIDVLEHVEDCYGFLRGLRKKGEYKIFHIPLDLSVQSVLRMKPIMNNRKQVGHIHYFTKDTALAFLEDTGYKVIDYFYTASSLELGSKSLKNRLASWPRKILFKLNKDFAVRLLGGYSLMVLTK